VAVFVGTPSPAQLCEALADARAAGQPFDQAWPALIADYSDRSVLEDEAVTAAWRRAFERQPPTPADRAAARLAALVGAA
jgi:hypothetical protein